MERFAEWTFEGGLNQVGVTGNRTRYQSGLYGSEFPIVQEMSGHFSQDEWYRDNNDLLPSQATAWGGFFV
jgi:hypothetical protein